MTSNLPALSETIFCLLVRFYFGALLAIISYLSLVSAFILIFDSHGMAAGLVPVILLLDLMLISIACLFAAWQWQRIPKKWWMVVFDMVLAGLIIVGLQWCRMEDYSNLFRVTQVSAPLAPEYLESPSGYVLPDRGHTREPWRRSRHHLC